MLRCIGNPFLPTRPLLLLVVLLVLLRNIQADNPSRRGGGRVRGEGLHDEALEQILQSIDYRQRRRKLFGERWADPSRPNRGGAGAAAKGLFEVIGMRDRIIPGAPSTPPTTGTGGATPTSRPTVPYYPEPSPTQGPTRAQDRNDRCQTARGPVQVTPQGFGNSRAVIYDDTTEGGQVPNVNPDRCNRITNSAPGVWYYVIGTGELMTASLCWEGTTFDTKLTIYRGDCNGAMTCVNANDDAAGTFGTCQVNRQASRVQWPSERGVRYHILIHGFGTRTGDFQLNVFNYTPLNDSCQNAQPIQPGQAVIGTTFQANFPFDGESTNWCVRAETAFVSLHICVCVLKITSRLRHCLSFLMLRMVGDCTCFSDVLIRGILSFLCCSGGQFGLIGDASSVWYRVMGNGQIYEASTCNPNTAPNFDTKLHIFEGDCDIDSCIGGNDNYNSPERCSLTTWDTKVGTEYWILVHGFLTSNGLFELSVRQV